MRPSIAFTALLLILAACGDEADSELDAGAADAGGSDDGGAPLDAGPPTAAEILEVYYGLDMLPLQTNALCAGMSPAVGRDGMPVTFSVQIAQASVSADDFAIETADGEMVTPDCATLAPALEPLELRTVLLVGNFGTPEAPPRGVEVVGTLADVDGDEFTGVSSRDVTPLEDGPGLVLAERFLPDDPGIAGECPAESRQVVQMVWGGGVSGPAGAALDETQRLGVSVTLEDESVVTPIALADDDPDNYVYACLAEDSPALGVSVAAGLFHDPGDDANPATSAPVIDRVP